MIVGLDVGGTHTDVVVLQGKEIISKVKLLTDEEDLLQTVCFGIFEAIQGLKVQSIERVVVSTTLATNAIVQVGMRILLRFKLVNILPLSVF